MSRGGCRIGLGFTLELRPAASGTKLMAPPVVRPRLRANAAARELRPSIFPLCDEVARMARKNRTGVLKRLREVKKAEKAAMKREEHRIRREAEASGAARPRPEAKSEPQVATADDLAGYGFPVDADEEEEPDRS